MSHIRSLRIAALTLMASVVPALAQPVETPLVRGNGCDALVGNASGVSTYGNATINGQLVRAFAVGTNTWNIGNRPMEWVSTGNNHPKLFQNIYRANGKQFQHVALGWGKRGFAVANGTINASFGPCVTASTATMPSKLGINCTDPYGAGTNAGQSNLGPRFDINPITGAFTPGNATGLIPAVAVSNIDRRCVGFDSDFQPPSSTGATYYAEAFVVSPDDALWGNSRNNYSTRKLATLPTLTSGSASQNLPFATTPNYRATAIEHFAADTPGVTLTFTDFHERDNTFLEKYEAWDPGETSIVVRPSPLTTTVSAMGRFITTSSATNNNDGTWTYDYSVFNANSHRAGGSFTLRIPSDAVVSSKSFHAPFYHSGDRFLNLPWTATSANIRTGWNVDPTTQQVAVTGIGTVTFEPNALMFGSSYNFRLVCNVPPQTGVARLGLFRAPADGLGYQGQSLAITGLLVPSVCAADVGVQGGVLGTDGHVDNNDFVAFLDAFFANDLLVADIGTQGGLAGADNELDNNDFVVFIDLFFANCAEG